jgi:hypothetical protein
MFSLELGENFGVPQIPDAKGIHFASTSTPSGENCVK